jgi:hypothetical protein
VDSDIQLPGKYVSRFAKPRTDSYFETQKENGGKGTFKLIEMLNAIAFVQQRHYFAERLSIAYRNIYQQKMITSWQTTLHKFFLRRSNSFID